MMDGAEKEKGYCQKLPYDKAAILNGLHTEWAGKTVHFAEKTDSTNLWAKALAREGAPHGTLAAAEFQWAGRGRFDRKWTAGEGGSVIMSLVLRPKLPPVSAPMLTLVMGLSVARAVEELGFSPQIKWPNDVALSGKKICGILTEMGLRGEKIDYVVVGVGINVNIEGFSPELSDKATSLYLEKGEFLDRSLVLSKVLGQFEKNYERFVEAGDLKPLMGAYNRLLANRERTVRVLNAGVSGESFEGTAHGINSLGELLVEREDGELVRVAAGEVSVRGLYTYI